MMGAPSRLSNGVNTSSGNDTTNMMGQLDPSYYHTQFDDFDFWAAANWTITLVGTGSEALLAGDGGLLQVSTSAGVSDSVFVQDPVPSFVVAPNYPLYFKALLSLSDVNLSQAIVGLQNSNSAPLTASATNGIWILKGPGAPALSLVSRSAGVTTTISLPAILVNNKMVEVGFAYDGKGTIYAYVDENMVGSVSPAALPVGNLALQFGMQNGAAAIKTMLVDYLLAAKAR